MVLLNESSIEVLGVDKHKVSAQAAGSLAFGDDGRSIRQHY
jgi:hypothetical protein